MVVFCFGKFGHVSIQMVLFQESKVELSVRWFGGFKNTSGDEVFLRDSLLIERHSRLRGRDAGCFRSHGHNHGLWKHGKSRRSKGFLEQILISCKSLRSVAVGFSGYTNHNAFLQNHHLQVNKSRYFFLKPLFSLFVMYSCFHKFGRFSYNYLSSGSTFPLITWGPWDIYREKKSRIGQAEMCEHFIPILRYENLGSKKGWFVLSSVKQVRNWSPRPADLVGVWCHYSAG